MTDVRRIAIFTGTRADWGLLRRLAARIQDDPRAELVLIVSGSHLLESQGGTVDEVERDGLPIAHTVPIWSDDDAAGIVAADAGSAVGAFGAVLDRDRPDVVVVLGDRLEALAMALAATIMGVPVAHIHGGEVTEGAMDDALRHAITKLSHVHLTTTPEHAARVLQLGEGPGTVHVAGAPAQDSISQLDLLDASELGARFGVDLTAPSAIVTFHPAAFDEPPTIDLVDATLRAFDAIPDLRIVFTGTNNDIGGAEIRTAIRDFVERNGARASYVESFGQLGYLSALRAASAAVGNSSSVVLEAPLVGTPSVLIGMRQRGRPLADSVLTPAEDGIEAAVRDAIDPDRAGRGIPSDLFGGPGFAGRALEILLAAELPTPPIKRFHDIGEVRWSA